jgi:hypothetical protein
MIKIEHRLFSFISINWRGKPAATYRTVVELIAATTTRTGLKVADAELAAVPLKPHEWHPDWNLLDRAPITAQLIAPRPLAVAAQDPAGTEQAGPVDGFDLYVLAGLGGGDHVAVSYVEADVEHIVWGAVEDEVTR